MRVIVSKPNSGKTDALIEIAGKEFAYIVVAGLWRAEAVHRRAQEMGVSIPFPLTHGEFIRGEFLGRGIRAFVIDDVDDLVRKMAGEVSVLAISATEADAEEEERFQMMAQEVADGWREDKARRRMAGTFDLPAGALEVPPGVQDLVERLSETQRRRQEEAFRCLTVPTSWFGDDGEVE